MYNLEDRKVIDGHDFFNALICGINRIILEEDILNKINVFPVPDGADKTINLPLLIFIIYFVPVLLFSLILL